MADSNDSKITAFMLAAADILKGSVPGIADVIILGRHDVEAETLLSTTKSGGQAVTIVAAGGTNTQGRAKGPTVQTQFLVTVYDQPNIRKHGSRHGYELAEDVIRSLHGVNTQELHGQCEDCLFADWSIAPDEEDTFIMYTVSFNVTLKYSPLPTSTS